MKIAICDDEEHFRAELQEHIKPYEENNSSIEISEYSCGEDLIDAYEKGQGFDLVFLDVEMSGLSGVDVGKRIRQVDNNVMFFFVTAYPNYVPEAFSLGAIQFLVKPVTQQMFNKEFDRAMCIYQKKNTDTILLSKVQQMCWKPRTLFTLRPVEGT